MQTIQKSKENLNKSHLNYTEKDPIKRIKIYKSFEGIDKEKKNTEEKINIKKKREKIKKLKLKITISEETKENGKSIDTLSVSPCIFVKSRKGNFSKSYEIGDLIGEGGYGKVFLVNHKTTSFL